MIKKIKALLANLENKITSILDTMDSDLERDLREAIERHVNARRALIFIFKVRIILANKSDSKYIAKRLLNHEVLFFITRVPVSRWGKTYLKDYADIKLTMDTMAAHVDPAPLCEPLMNLVDVNTMFPKIHKK